MANLVWQRPNNEVAITTIYEAIDPLEYATKLQTEGVIPNDWALVAINVVIPEDRTFRNAWTWTDKIDHDMGKARELHRAKMRIARAPLLAALDVEQLRGQNVESEKQALRDVTSDPAIEAAANVEELKAVWPAILQ